MRDDAERCRAGKCSHYYGPGAFKVGEVPDDAATKACVEWVRAWRETVGPDVARPPLLFAQALGREAVAMQADGARLGDMLRIFSAAGRDGATPSGHPSVRAS